jgi:hypothetical protein
LTGPQVSGCSEPGYVLLLYTGSVQITLPGSPSLVCWEKNGPGAWRSSSPRRRVVVYQMNLRDARIALSLHGLRWHAFCWRSVVIPAIRIRGSSSVSRARGLLRALTNTDPVPKGHRTTATLSKGRWSVNPCRFAAPAPVRIGVPPSHSSGAKSCRVRTPCAFLRNAQLNGRRVGAHGRRRSLPQHPAAAPRSNRAPVAPGRGEAGRAAR